MEDMRYYLFNNNKLMKTIRELLQSLIVVWDDDDEDSRYIDYKWFNTGNGISISENFALELLNIQYMFKYNIWQKFPKHQDKIIDLSYKWVTLVSYAEDQSYWMTEKYTWDEFREYIKD